MPVSQNPNVEERTPDAPVDLEQVGEQLRGEAADGDGRAALTLTPSLGGPLKQTVIFVTGGQSFDENGAPGPASVLMLSGSGVLRHQDEDLRLDQGNWAPLPTDPYELSADEDLVLLLTVTPNA